MRRRRVAKKKKKTASLDGFVRICTSKAARMEHAWGATRSQGLIDLSVVLSRAGGQTAAVERIKAARRAILSRPGKKKKTKNGS